MDAPKRLRERLYVPNEEPARLHEGQQTLEQIASVRERREELVTEYARTEKALSEIIESLGPPRSD